MKITLAAVAISVCRVVAQLETSDFVLYHDYSGNLVAGKVYIGEVAQDHLVVFADLTNVDAACTGAQNGENNKCGIHIHEGTNCSENTGGHYWNENFTVDDPWKPVTYTGVTDQVTKVEDIVVGTGFNLDELNGRAFVVHDSTGARVACAILQKVGAAIKSMKVAKFGKYPTDTGKEVTATVTVAQHVGDQQVLEFDITGGDMGCTPGLVNSAKNGCGIHIHEGTTCEYADQVEGHHYKKDGRADPWLKITYRTENAKGITIPVDTGLEASEVYGRTVVVHDKDGGRMACGRILLAENPPLKTMDFVPYSGYSPVVLQTEGVVSVGQSGTGVSGTQVLFAMLNDTDPACAENQDAKPANVCGMHIHTEKDCSANTGGHYWNTEELGEGAANDPWKNRYKASAPHGEVSEVNVHIKTAFDLKDMESRAFVVHDSKDNGVRVACALLERATVGATLIHESDFEKYPIEPAPTLVVSGQVGVHQSGESAQFLTYSLSGLDAQCTADKVSADNECGIHIHEGATCAESGGHHYDKSIGPDPWLRIRYVATSTTLIFTGTTVAIETGIPLSGLYGRALVVHDAGGKRIACTLIQSATTAPTPAPTPPTPAPGTQAPGDSEDDDGPPALALGLIGIIVVGCCGAGGWFYMNQESGYDAQEDAGEGGNPEPEIEMQTQEE